MEHYKFKQVKIIVDDKSLMVWHPNKSIIIDLNRLTALRIKHLRRNNQGALVIDVGLDTMIIHYDFNQRKRVIELYETIKQKMFLNNKKAN